MHSKALSAVAVACAVCKISAQVLEDPPQVQRTAEVFPSGASKVIRMEAHRVEESGEHSELMELMANASEAQYPRQAGMVTTGAQQAPPDEKNANAYCGGPAFVSSCGFKTSNEVCFTTAQGRQECVRGLCVCTHPQGCIEPVCDKDSCKNQAAAECADGNSCIKSPGDGWECWHACNAAHSYAEYGHTNGKIVNHIRTMTQSCAAYGISPPANPGGGAGGSSGAGGGGGYRAAGGGGAYGGVGGATEPPLDGGIDLTYQSSPIFGSQVSSTKSGSERKYASVALISGVVGLVAALSQ